MFTLFNPLEDFYTLLFCLTSYFLNICMFQVYDLSQIFTSIYFKGYAGLSKSQQVEWNNR